MGSPAVFIGYFTCSIRAGESRAGDLFSVFVESFSMARCLRAFTIAIGVAALVPRLEAASGSWSIMPPLPSVIQEVAVASMDGLVYVAAGSASQMRTNALWSFDPATAVWTRLAPYSRPAPRHTAPGPPRRASYLFCRRP